MRRPPEDLREFLAILARERDVRTIDVEVDPHLELAEIHRRVIAAGGPALHFTRVKGSPFPVVTNLFGSARRVELAFGGRPREILAEVARLPDEMMPPTLGRIWRKRGLLRSLSRVGLATGGSGPAIEVVETPPRLGRLPALTSWSDDGGPFFTLPLVYTEHPETRGHNLGMYRMHRYDDAETGMHFQIGKGGGFHLAAAEALGRPLPVQVLLGGPPALMLAAIAPLPENVPELLLASLVLGNRLPMVKHRAAFAPIPAGAEFTLIGEVPANVRRAEGPFGDHYGYYSLVHDYPVFRCKTMLRRKRPIFPATVVGKPRQEDFFLGDYLQDLLSPLFPLVMPGVRALWSYGETGYHSLSAAIVRDRFKREAMSSAFRILGEGQLSLTKFLLVTDGAVDLRDFRATLEHVLARTDLRTDLHVFSNLSMDSLDYTGPVINEGSKGVLLGVGDPVRELPSGLGAEPTAVRRAFVFCRGCLVVDGPPHPAEPKLAARVAADPAFSGWPLVVLVDDAAHATRSQMNFLWTTFTRFDPGSDIHCATERVVRHHRVFEAPVVIDARKKASYPEELFCDPVTAATVERRWREYFPDGQEMGSSDHAHLD